MIPFVKRPRIVNFSMLPNMVTMLNLFTGFLSILMTVHGKLSVAAWLLILALIWDSLDGNIARIFKNPTQLGKELDSLADIVSFVVAPALLVFQLQDEKLGIWNLLLAFGFLGTGAFRLARFNIRAGRKDIFEGLPTPAAALTLGMTALAYDKNGWIHLSFGSTLLMVLTALLSFLMVSRIHYPKLSAIPLKKWSSLLYLGVIVFVGVSFFMNLEAGLSSMSLIFLSLAPTYCLSTYSEKSAVPEPISHDSH
jgi:CDP-diacylglycerol---serine O-phosphatidyltransferase